MSSFQAQRAWFGLTQLLRQRRRPGTSRAACSHLSRNARDLMTPDRFDPVTRPAVTLTPGGMVLIGLDVLRGAHLRPGEPWWRYAATALATVRDGGASWAGWQGLLVQHHRHGEGRDRG